MACGGGEGDHDVVAGDDVGDLHGVAHRVHVGVRRQTVLVHDDAAPRTEAESCGFGQAALGTDAKRENDDVGGEAAARCRHNDNALACLARFEGLHTVAQNELDSLRPDGVCDLVGELAVQRWQHLRKHLQHADVEPETMQVLHHLHTDETAPNHHRPLGADSFHPCFELLCVRNRLDCEYRRKVDAWDGWLQRSSPWSED
mmetsp:Transcript_64672/g.140863  ORF Transcript_64672/g.140863 Transcript_64672/m.140863 type:complete len:201 (-) Transcript_64672:475-1077(-)